MAHKYCRIRLNYYTQLYTTPYRNIPGQAETTVISHRQELQDQVLKLTAVVVDHSNADLYGWNRPVDTDAVGAACCRAEITGQQAAHEQSPVTP